MNNGHKEEKRVKVGSGYSNVRALMLVKKEQVAWIKEADEQQGLTLPSESAENKLTKLRLQQAENAALTIFANF